MSALQELRDELARLKSTVERADDRSPDRAQRLLRRQYLEQQLRAHGVDPGTVEPAP